MARPTRFIERSPLYRRSSADAAMPHADIARRASMREALLLAMIKRLPRFDYAAIDAGADATR